MFNSVGLPLYLCLDGFVYVLDGFGLPCGGIVSVDSRGCHLVVLLDGEGALHSSGLLFGMRYTLVGYMAPCLFLLSLGWVIDFLRDYDFLGFGAPYAHAQQALRQLAPPAHSFGGTR